MGRNATEFVNTTKQNPNKGGRIKLEFGVTTVKIETGICKPTICFVLNRWSLQTKTLSQV